MPTSSQNSVALNLQSIRVLKANNTIIPEQSFESSNTIYTDEIKKKSLFNTKSKASRKTTAFNDDSQKFVKKRNCTRPSLIISIILLALLIMSIIVIAIVLPIMLIKKASTTTTTTTTTTTVTTTTTTTTVTTATIAPICVSPYVQAPSGNCVNILLDFNNCGVLGKNCSNNYTSCSAGVCSIVPVVQLTNATSIWTGGINGAADDNIFYVILPFNITLYNTTTNYIQITVNGVLCLSYCSDNWVSTSLPSNSFGATVFPYWDDLYIYSKTWQGIYFASQGIATNRTLIFEYYTTHYGIPNDYDHFQVVFFEASPGLVQFIYFQADDGGAHCTIGIQASNNGPFIQYSFDQANSVQPNMTLTFNSTAGSYTNSTIG